ncbi:TolC family protein [Sphaerochaeta sp. PS]|uniref:TolC family protein n=1 Tax=Sphaerochaeta sp. PS TaxID=3076336 RepID=UPI0028A2F085|nr:TolC family protein [Sphaerochaeta sp. PS]MDT4761672.1 TolC family protein [Sphaerochaeta sp. PS]
MHKHNLSLSLIFLLCLFGFPPLGAEAITLDTALDLAYSNNLSLRMNMIDLKGAQRAVDTSWNLFLPKVSASLSNSGNTGVFITDPSFKSTTSLGLSVSLMLNPAVKEQLSSSKLDFTTQSVTLAQAKATLKRDVTKSFYYLLMEKENLLLQQANLDLAQKQYAQVKEKYESAFASELELLSAQLSYESLKPAFTQTKNAYASALLSFKVLLGLDLAQDIQLDGTVPSIGDGLTLENLENYLQQNFSLKLLDLNLSSLQNAKDLQSKVSLLPTLSLSSSYGINYSEPIPFGATKHWSDATQYNITVSIPLDAHIAGSGAQVSLQKMQDSIDKLFITRELTRKQLSQALASRVDNLNAMTEQLEVANFNLQLTEKVYGMTMAQYQSGYTGYLEVEKIQGDLLKAKQNILGLQYQYITGFVDLMYDLNIDTNTLEKEL